MDSLIDIITDLSNGVVSPYLLGVLLYNICMNVVVVSLVYTTVGTLLED